MEALEKLGIDPWGILLYLINYGILLGVLAYFFYPKILALIDKRRETIRKNLEEAALLQKELEIRMEAHKKDRDVLMADLQKQSNDLKKDFADKRAELLKSVEDEKAKWMAEAKAELKKEKDSLIKSAEKDILEIMKKALLYVVSNKIPEDVAKGSVKDAWEEYKSISLK